MSKVLMIEDDFDFAEIMLECLHADPDCQVMEVITNQADARFKMECTGMKDVDAVLVDLQLCRSKSDPRVNSSAGLEIISEMRVKYDFKGRVIVLTNSSSLTDGHKA